MDQIKSYGRNEGFHEKSELSLVIVGRDLPMELMELIEDQYYASKDENMEKLPNFRKFIAYYTLRNSFLV